MLTPYAAHIYYNVNLPIVVERKMYLEMLNKLEYNMVDNTPLAIEIAKG